MDDLMDVKETAKLTRLAQSSVYGLVSKKAIPCFKLGSRVVFSKKEIGEWIESQRQPHSVEAAPGI